MTDYKAISNCINDCFMYFRDVLDFTQGDDDEIVYRLLCLADVICDKHIER